ncbi:hypothetical protein JHK85_023177 [Glycine max]|uniref:Uncharacterized protein n=1 Tax=Glycine max TaxID=3847 RepID=A0A0R0ITC1_SOYBN|nr:hypothetical protein JHK85_023177 [Glycine max]
MLMFEFRVCKDIIEENKISLRNILQGRYHRKEMCTCNCSYYNSVSHLKPTIRGQSTKSQRQQSFQGRL